MTIIKKLALLVAVATCAALPDSAAQAAATGSASTSTPSARTQRERTPEEQALAAYNSGVKQIKKAADYDEDAAKASSPEKREKAEKKAASAYEKALGEFQNAVSLVPTLYEAWNYIGFAQRHLGRYDAALDAYAKALQLKPGFPEAIEYRGEAYLGLNRLDDARQAYMELFSGSRKLADQLLGSMQKFVDTRRETPNGLEPQKLEEFAKWVQERATIAQQTASLDTGADNTSWR